MATLPELVSPISHGIAPPNPPRYPAEDLLSLVNKDIRKPFDMKEVLLRIVDDSRLSMFKPSYGRNLLTAFAQIQGATASVQEKNKASAC